MFEVRAKTFHGIRAGSHRVQQWILLRVILLELLACRRASLCISKWRLPEWKKECFVQENSEESTLFKLWMVNR